MGNVIWPMWAECPALTRAICVGYPSLSILVMMIASTSIGSGLVDSIFTCSIANVAHFKLWTLFIGPFFSPIGSGMNFLFMLFEIYMGMQYFPIREKEMGSLTFLVWMCVMNALINLVYLAAMCLVWKIQMGQPFSMLMFAPFSNKGLWPLIIVLLTLRMMSDPNGSSSVYGMFQIPNKWYPVGLVAVFCLISGPSILWNFVAALAIGYGYPFARFDRLMPSKVRISRIEQRCCQGGRCNLLSTSWVPATSTAAYEVETGDRRYATLSDFGRTSTGGSQLSVQGRNVQPDSSGGGGGGGNFTAFAGSGNRLGDGSNELVQPVQGQELRSLPASGDAQSDAAGPDNSA